MAPDWKVRHREMQLPAQHYHNRRTGLRGRDRKTQRAALCLFLLAGAAHAILVSATETNPAQLSDNTTQTYTLTGTVTNSVTGQPIRRALVQVQTYPQHSAFTDDQGHFEFDNLPPGMVSIAVQRPGYFADRSATPMQTYQIGPDVQPLALKLTPQGVIRGRVTNQKGEGLSQIPVHLRIVNVEEGRKHVEPNNMTQTDEDGWFRFPNLMPGTYYLSAGPGWDRDQFTMISPMEAKQGYATTYYPGVPNFTSASPIPVGSGQQSETDIVLESTPVYRVTGTVAGYARDQGVAFQFLNDSGDDVQQFLQFDREKGTFEARMVAPGTYTLLAQSQIPGPPMQMLQASARVTVAADISDVHLQLQPTLSIPVEVHKDDVAPASSGLSSRMFAGSVGGEAAAGGTTVMVHAGPISEAPVSIQLASVGSDSQRTSGYSQLEGKPGQQALWIRNLFPGKYRATFFAEAPWYVQSAHYGQTNLLQEDLTINSGETPGALEVVLRNDSATLTGTIKADGTEQSGTVLVLPEQTEQHDARLAMFSPGAPFQLSGLPPGNYIVMAFDKVDDLEFRNPEVLEAYLSRAAHVTLGPNGQSNVALELIRRSQ